MINWGFYANSYGALLVPALLSKLPDGFTLEISRGVEDCKWKLDKLLKKLIAEIAAREGCYHARQFLRSL